MNIFIEVKRFLANQINLNVTELNVINCDTIENPDTPQFEMRDDEMRDDDEEFQETLCKINQSLNLLNAVSSSEQVTFFLYV